MVSIEQLGSMEKLFSATTDLEQTIGLRSFQSDLDLNAPLTPHTSIDGISSTPNSFLEPTHGEGRIEPLSASSHEIRPEELNSPMEPIAARDVSEGGLTPQEAERLHEETSWPKDIIGSIRSMDEAKIYQEAHLEVREINGKNCLIKLDIDMELKDEFGRTNQERMNAGLAPLDKDLRPIELHHIGQHSDSPLAELTRTEHRGPEHDRILHDKTRESEISRVDFRAERENHWRSRIADINHP